MTVTSCTNTNKQLSYKFDVTSKKLSTKIVDNIENSTFEVHYIDVEQADSSLVLCDGHSMLIDGGNAEDINLIAAYLKKENISSIDYLVCTHAHEDYVGGLSGALSVAEVKNGLLKINSPFFITYFPQFLFPINSAQCVILCIPYPQDTALLFCPPHQHHF